MAMTKAKKKKLVSIICGRSLPQSAVDDDCKFAYSTNSKYTSTILFDETAIDEWVSSIITNDNINTFYIVTSSPTVFRKAKEKVQAAFDPIFESKQVFIPMANGFKANVKYFKCDWTPRMPEDYPLSNVLCCHIREMIELQNAIEIDNVKNVIVLNKKDFKDFVMKPDVYTQIENIWVNQNIIFNSEELRLLEAKGFKYIPKEFFGHELREAAE